MKLPQMPKMPKMPQGPKKPQMPEGMKGIQTPTVVKNVYRDLRDRRLLSIAIVLVVAIVAVPFLIKGEDESAPPPLAGDAGRPVPGAEILDAAVLTEQPVLRDFRKRLDRYRTRNPFKQQLTAVPSAGLDDLSEDAERLDRRRQPAPTTSALDAAAETGTTDAGTEPEEPIDPDSTAPDGEDGGEVKPAAPRWSRPGSTSGSAPSATRR